MEKNIAFGPVPSRRLGSSLGVNNVFDKYCSYSCIYCQIGHTTQLTIDRRIFYDTDKLVEETIIKARETNPDVITFVPNGEPTLDINLGREAEKIKDSIDKPLAILTNSSLLYREDVVNDLCIFDIVSIKIDTVNEEIWGRINRPHPRLDLGEILDGIKYFARLFRGRLLVETMLVDRINTDPETCSETARFIAEIKPFKTYIQIPIRPPAEKWVKPPSENTLFRIYNVFNKYIGEKHVELLMSPETSDFRFKGDLVKEIINTIYVHPIRLEYVRNIAWKHGLEPEVLLNNVLETGLAKIIVFNNEEFLVPKTRK